MATLTVLIDNTVPTAADFMGNFNDLNTEVRLVTTGGTGLSSYTAGDFLYASGVTTLAKLAGGTRGQALLVGGSTAPIWGGLAPPGYLSRLLITRTNATAVNVTADVLELLNAAGAPVYISGVNVSPAITASGVNGLDFGAEASDTWYYIHVIYNGTTVAGLLSTFIGPGAIVFPVGYTFARLVGVVFNGSGDFTDFRQVGQRYYWAGDNANVYPPIFTDQTGQTSFTLLDIFNTIPANRVRQVRGIMGNSVVGATSGMAVSPNSSGEYAAIALGDSTGITKMMNWAGAWPFEIPFVSGTSLYWRTPATGANYRVAVSGFELDL